LTNELVVNSSIVLGSESLLEESEENRDNNTGLETLAKADEEDCASVSIKKTAQLKRSKNYQAQQKRSEAFCRFTASEIRKC
jgi:hypothetical protein